jgi:lysozyme
MELSAAGLELIKKSEGFRSHTYTDVAGFATIGYGHRLLLHESFPDGITEAQGAEILAEDVRLAESAVERLVKISLTQGQFDALTDFCFNLGAGRLASSTLLVELNSGNLQEAQRQLLRWDMAAGEANGGLEARRRAECELWGEGAPPQNFAA